MNYVKFAIFNEQDEEVEHELPGKYEVCSRCEGHGTHLNPSIGEHAYSVEEFEREFDEEERQEYFARGGMYDVECHVCKGKRVELVVDRNLAEKQFPALLKQYDEMVEREDRYARERAQEERMGY